VRREWDRVALLAKIEQNVDGEPEPWAEEYPRRSHPGSPASRTKDVARREIDDEPSVDAVTSRAAKAAAAKFVEDLVVRGAGTHEALAHSRGSSTRCSRSATMSRVSRWSRPSRSKRSRSTPLEGA